MWKRNKMIHCKNDSEVLLPSITENRKTLIEQTQTKPRATINSSVKQPVKALSL